MLTGTALMSAVMSIFDERPHENGPPAVVTEEQRASGRAVTLDPHDGPATPGPACDLAHPGRPAQAMAPGQPLEKPSGMGRSPYGGRAP